MSDRLDDLLKALPPAQPDHPLDQLEPQVWRRIERARRGATAVGTVQFQLAAAGIALCIGLAFGWTMSRSSRPAEDQAVVYASYVEAGPLARLGEGL